MQHCGGGDSMEEMTGRGGSGGSGASGTSAPSRMQLYHQLGGGSSVGRSPPPPQRGLSPDLMSSYSEPATEDSGGDVTMAPASHRGPDSGLRSYYTHDPPTFDPQESSHARLLGHMPRIPSSEDDIFSMGGLELGNSNSQEGGIGGGGWMDGGGGGSAAAGGAGSSGNWLDNGGGSGAMAERVGIADAFGAHHLGPVASGGSANSTGSGDGAAAAAAAQQIEPSRMLFARGVPPDISDAEVRDMFQVFGDLRNVYTACRHRGFVMVGFFDLRAATSAFSLLQGTHVRGSALELLYAAPTAAASQESALQQGTLVVFNLDPDASNAHLGWLFSKFGDVRDIRESPSRRSQKFVTFYDTRHAAAALRAMNRAEQLGMLPGALTPAQAAAAHRLPSSASHHLSHPQFQQHQHGHDFPPPPQAHHPSSHPHAPLLPPPLSQPYHQHQYGGPPAQLAHKQVLQQQHHHHMPSQQHLQHPQQQQQFYKDAGSGGVVDARGMQCSDSASSIGSAAVGMQQAAANALAQSGGYARPTGLALQQQQQRQQTQQQHPHATAPGAAPYSQAGGSGAFGYPPSASFQQQQMHEGGGEGVTGRLARLSVRTLNSPGSNDNLYAAAAAAQVDLQVQQLVAAHPGLSVVDATNLVLSYNLSDPQHHQHHQQAAAVWEQQQKQEDAAAAAAAQAVRHRQHGPSSAAAAAPPSAQHSAPHSSSPSGTPAPAWSSGATAAGSDRFQGGDISASAAAAAGRQQQQQQLLQARVQKEHDARMTALLQQAIQRAGPGASHAELAAAAAQLLQAAGLAPGGGGGLFGLHQNTAAGGAAAFLPSPHTSTEAEWRDGGATTAAAVQLLQQAGFQVPEDALAAVASGTGRGAAAGWQAPRPAVAAASSSSVGGWAAMGAGGGSSSGAVPAAALEPSTRSGGGGGGRSSRRGQDPQADAERKIAQERLYSLDAAKILGGEDPRTTLMIKNIPNKYTQKMLLTTMDDQFRGAYDFFYLPIDFKNKCNVGYAFLNVVRPELIVPLVERFHARRWERFNSEKVCHISYARIQGRAALVAHFQNSSLMHEDKRCRPILFASDGSEAGDQ